MCAKETHMLKMAIITGFLSKTKDRFHEYNQPLDLDGKFKLMTEMDGFDGVEIVYPYEVSDPAKTRAVLKKYKLKVAAAKGWGQPPAVAAIAKAHIGRNIVMARNGLKLRGGPGLELAREYPVILPKKRPGQEILVAHGAAPSSRRETRVSAC